MSTWFHLESTALLDKLATDLETGVTRAKAEQRLAQQSPNELVEWGLTNPWRILWEQLTAAMVVILIVAALISALLGDYKDAIAILVIVILQPCLLSGKEYSSWQELSPWHNVTCPPISDPPYVLGFGSAGGRNNEQEKEVFA